MLRSRPATMVTSDRALPGRVEPSYSVSPTHAVLGSSMIGPHPEGTAVVYVGLGCFWGAEKLMWQLPGVVTTAVGYQGGFTPNPTYEEVCTGLTGHTEVVMVAYDPTQLPAIDIAREFWANHDPTQGFRQGNDIGSQYRSAFYWTTPEQFATYESTRELFQQRLFDAGFGAITTDVKSIEKAGPFYYAEDYHQQYLKKNPAGYCPVHSTGVACPVPE